MIHEAAHAWFNGSLLADRWANEGFASLYAQRAAAAIKEKAASPALTDDLKKAAIPLDAWAPATPDAEGDATSATAAATERYGYAASLALAKAIAERAGDDTLKAVWARAAARIGAYQPVAPAGAVVTQSVPGAGGRRARLRARSWTSSRTRPAPTSPTCGGSG